MEPQIIYEDNHLIAVNKPSGWLVHSDITEDLTLADYVKNYIKLRYNKPGDVFLGVIHRLDRPVSGAVVFARTSKGLSRMNELFRNREIEKTYLAITTSRPEPISGHLSDFILKDHKKNVAKIYDKIGRRTKDAKKAELDYRMIGEIGRNYLIEVKPITGRPHQIRVQLAKLGCSIRGDLKYGFRKPNPDASIHLHCTKLAFTHPIKKIPVTIEADRPSDQHWNMFKDIF